jgi:OsmC-like protein
VGGEFDQHRNDRGGLEVTVVADTIRNGVDTEKMFATLDLIKAQPELARFQFRATNRWIDGAHNRSTIKGFYAAGGEDTSRSEEFHLDTGEPAILLGSDTGPNPAEYLLHALAACLTTSIVYVAAARKVELTSVESTLTGDMDVRGALGVDDEPRNGFERSAWRSVRRATRRRRSCERSSSGPASAPPSTTWSRAACPSPSR